MERNVTMSEPPSIMLIGNKSSEIEALRGCLNILNVLANFDLLQSKDMVSVVSMMWNK